MSRLMPFAIQEKGRGYFSWSNATSDSTEFFNNSSVSYHSGWGEDGNVLFQQASRLSAAAWILTLKPGKSSIPIKMHPVDGQVMFCYLLSGCLQLKCRWGEYNFLPGSWQMLPGNLPEIELNVNEATRLFWVVTPAVSLSGYKQTFPDVIDWLLAPTFFTWYEPRNGTGNLQPHMKNAIESLAGVSTSRLSSDEVWLLVDRILVCAMGELSRHLHLAGQEVAVAPCRPVEATIARTAILAAIQKDDPTPLSRLAKAVNICERSLQLAFKLQYGLSMMDYFLATKMEAVARQIIYTGQSLQEIGINFHYKDYSTFSNAVSRWWGISPRRIRENGYLPTRLTKDQIKRPCLMYID